MLKDFRPAIRFLLVFVGLYLVANLLYGLWIRSYGEDPDPLTRMVTQQTTAILNLGRSHASSRDNTQGPTVFIETKDRIVLNVYEGCNGINVQIVFLAFVAAFGGSGKRMAWFIPLGLLLIHLANLCRIVMLYVVAQHYQRYFYYVHKYLFTAGIYAAVFILWLAWIRINGRQKQTEPA